MKSIKKPKGRPVTTGELKEVVHYTISPRAKAILRTLSAETGYSMSAIVERLIHDSSAERLNRLAIDSCGTVKKLA